MSTAERFFKKYGAAVALEHVKRPADGAELYKCEKGHSNCAHSKNGACLVELAKLLAGV